MTSAHEIAAGVVSLLTTTLRTVQCQPVRQLVPLMDRTVDRPDLIVQPWSEEEESFDRGDALTMVRTVNVWWQAPNNGAMDESNFFQTLGQIKDSFREHEIAGDDGTWRWRRNETVVLADSDAAKARQLLSIFRAVYYNFE